MENLLGVWLVGGEKRKEKEKEGKIIGGGRDLFWLGVGKLVV